MIFVPKTVVNELVDETLRSSCNPRVCMKIEFRGYEISLSSDASLQGYGRDLTRTDIRVYEKDKDVTENFSPQSRVLSDGEDLFQIMRSIDRLLDYSSQNRNPNHMEEALALYPDPTYSLPDMAAIKRYRELSGCGLREAADLVRGEIRRRDTK